MPRESATLRTAEALIFGDRERDYGHPRDNFRRIAALWSALLGTAVSPEQVCLCMAAVKLSRLAQTPTHEDSRIDACGYLGLIERLQEETP